MLLKITLFTIYQYLKVIILLFKRYSIFNLFIISIWYGAIRIQYLLKYTKLLSNPPNVYLFITQRCNLNCTFCHYHGELLPEKAPESDAEMSLQDLQNLISKKIIKAPARACLYGGEPLINVDSFKMISLLNKNNFLTSIITNGVNLKDTHKELIASKLHFMTLSYYPGIIESAKPYIAEIGKNTIVNISYIISEKNINKLEDVIQFSIEANAKMITIENLIDKTSHDDNSLNDSEDYKKHKRYLLNKYASKIIFRWSDVNKQPEKENNNLPAEKPKIQCTEMWDMMLINKKGQILPCCQYPLKEFAGDFHQDQDYFNSPKIVALRKEMNKNNVPKDCEGCHYLHAKDPLYRFDL